MEIPSTSCGHDCCDDQHNPLHDHFLEPSVCLQCGRVRKQRGSVSSETVEKGAQAAFRGWKDYRRHNDVAFNDGGLWNAVAEAVLRSVEEGTQ